MGFEEYGVPDPVTPGFFERSLLAQPLVRIALRVPSLRNDWVPVTFVVDTGSAVTCLHASTVNSLFGVPMSDLAPERWGAATQLSGIGGELKYLVERAQFGFPTLAGGLEIIEDDIRLGEERSAGMPPILGMNLLRLFRVLIDSPASTVELTRPQAFGAS